MFGHMVKSPVPTGGTSLQDVTVPVFKYITSGSNGVLDKSDILERIRVMGNRLKDNYKIVAVGGTSLALHGLKEQTRDVDFIVEYGDILKFANTYKEQYDEIIHLAEPGTCFSVYMPADYMSRVENIGTFNNVTLYTLNILDTIVTKSTRFNTRDRDDLQNCTDINEEDLLSRIRDYSLKIEHMDNVKASMSSIFNIPQENLDAL